MAMSITIVKSFTYRGNAEEWSNKYHLSGTAPANSTDWKALADALIALERPMMPSQVTFVKAFGYTADATPSVYQINYADPPNTVLGGTLSYSPGATVALAPGDVAFWVRWATSKRNSKGRPIYARKYFHGAVITPPDTLLTGQRTAATTFAGKLTDDTLVGTRHLVLPDGTVAGTAKVVTYVTTRTLKRRGADPS